MSTDEGDLYTWGTNTNYLLGVDGATTSTMYTILTKLEAFK